MRNGPTAQPIPIGQPTPLVASDLERLKDPRWVASTPQRIRDSHHMIARLSAAGLRPFQVALKTGYSDVRVVQLLASPAMQELVARYREKVDQSFMENVDEFFQAATSNMLLSERMIADQLAAADESGELPSLRTLDAISQGRADRFGYGKKTQQTNINVDFAAALEKAIDRSGKRSALEGNATAGALTPHNVQRPSPERSLHPTTEAPSPPRQLLPARVAPPAPRPQGATEPRALIRRRA